MAVKAAPVPYVAPMYNWSGFYIGIKGGWGASRNRYEWTGPAGVTALDIRLMRLAALLAGRLAIICKPALGCWVSKLNTTGRI